MNFTQLKKKPFGQRLKKRSGSILSLLCLALSLNVPASLFAEEDLNTSITKTPIDMDADTLDMDRDNQVITAKGNVHITQEGVMALRADLASYHFKPKRIEASGNIQLTRQGDLFTSERLVLDIAKQQGALNYVKVDLDGPGGKAKADTIIIHDKNNLTLEHAFLTNCDCEKDPAWHITSEKIDINREKNSVTAKKVRLYLGDVPVVWVPWWQHPLTNKSKSGFLAPTFQIGGNGFEAEVPYYWNSASNRDATIALRSIEERGVMGKLQYRYLGENFAGKVDTNYIYDTQDEALRGLTVFDHQHRLDRWKAMAHFERSRTRDFVNEFEQNLVDARNRRLESVLTLDRFWNHDQGYTSFESGVRWYQDLDTENDDFTVQSLPFILVTDSRVLDNDTQKVHQRETSRWRMDTQARLDNFYQLSGDAVQRLDISPTLLFQKPIPIGQLKAAVALGETAYLLHGDPNQSEMDRESFLHRESSLLSLRLDGKLRKKYENSYQHTFEPTVQYVLNSATDQTQLPNYDATLRSFTTSNIFAHTLFSGIDRISNGHWVGYGLTTRLLKNLDNRSIRESGVFTIGQRWAPEGHREYQNDHPFSDVAASLEMRLSDPVTAAIMGRYDPYRTELDASDVVVSMDFAEKKQLELGYHFYQPNSDSALEEGYGKSVKDIFMSSTLGISDEWTWTQSTDYSLKFDQLKSWESSLSYEHQCWILRLTAGRQLATDTSSHGGNYFGFFLNLRGLGGYGV